MIKVRKLKGYPNSYYKFGFDFYNWSVNIYTGRHVLSISKSNDSIE